MDLNIGSVTNLSFVQDLFVMGIRNATTNERLPCTIIELMESEKNDIPLVVQDSNSFIGDTIIREPKQISVKVYVNSFDIDSFNIALSNAQTSKKGFSISGMYETYDNMRLLDKSYSETADVVGAIFVTLNFEEILFIQAYNEVLSVEQVKRLQDSDPVQGGNKVTKKSSLAFDIYK